MPDATNRPTPEQVIEDELCAEVEYGTIDRHAAGILGRLAEHGYVIVHPDDVPAMMGSDIAAYQDGFNACRDLVFWAGQ